MIRALARRQRPPPFGECNQAGQPATVLILPFHLIRLTPLGYDFQRSDGADAVYSLGIVTADQVGDLYQVVAGEAHQRLQIGGAVRFDELLLVKEVFVNALSAEQKGVRVVRDDSVHQP